jgi:hypothetical protein
MQALEDTMPLESEYVPDRTSRLSSLSPEDRRVYKKILWGLIGFYTAAIVALVGVVVAAGNIDFRKATDIVATSTRDR